MNFDSKRQNWKRIKHTGAGAIGIIVGLFLFFIVERDRFTQYQVQAAVREERLSAQEDTDEVYVTGIKLNYKTETLNLGDILQLQASLKLNDKSLILASDSEVTIKWKSSDKTIATVDKNGKLVAKSPGQVTVKAETSDGAHTVSCTITVKKPYLTTVKKTLYEKENYWLYVRNGNGEIKWQSSNPSVAKVSAKGKITAIGEGVTTITAIRSQFKMECKITVKKTRISKSKLVLYQGQTEMLSIIRTQKEITWSTSDKRVATISAKGVVTAKGVGKATIIGKIGTMEYSCVVTVNASNLLLKQYAAKIDSKGKYKIGMTCIKKDWSKVRVEVSDKSIVSVAVTDTIQDAGNLSILPLAKGSTEIRIYRTSEPMDIKILKITVMQEAVSEKPDIIVSMSENTLRSTQTGQIQIYNKGNKKLIVHADAYSYDFDYSGYDRRMRLLDEGTMKFLSSQNVRAGKKSKVSFQVLGKKTWYDMKTKYYFYIRYDGLEYEVISSHFLGTSIKLL